MTPMTKIQVDSGIVYPVLLLLEYDGSKFSGYQRQANAITVQESLENALFQLHGQKVPNLSSGRTDAGVHALGMPVQVLLPRPWDLQRLREGMNRFLPDGAAVVNAIPTRLPFNPRHAVLQKRYDYLLLTQSGRRPLLQGRAWLMPNLPDQDLAKKAIAQFQGQHDFSAFCTHRGDESTFVRHLKRAELRTKGQQWQFRFEASGFLYKMVRRMVGAALEVAQGKRPLEAIGAALTNPDQSPFKFTAPPDGLCLTWVKYPRSSFLPQIQPFPWPKAGKSSPD